jgi:hypothetical protein
LLGIARLNIQKLQIEPNNLMPLVQCISERQLVALSRMTVKNPPARPLQLPPPPTASPPPLPSLTTHTVSFGSEVHEGLGSKRCPAICPYGFTWLGSGSYKMSQSERDTLPDSPICVLTVHHPPPLTPPPPPPPPKLQLPAPKLQTSNSNNSNKQKKVQQKISITKHHIRASA